MAASSVLVATFLLTLFLCISGGTTLKPDYRGALRKAIAFFGGQRSGKLHESTLDGIDLIKWRGDSCLKDGEKAGVDLSGGYYDAGDNEKFNFPMAFTTTMLSWSAIEFGGNMMENELQGTMEAIKWATDYLLKCTVKLKSDGVLFVGVGDGNSEHNCWERPEDIDGDVNGGAKCRTVFSVSQSSPGSEVAAETAAALAAASIVFRKVDRAYSTKLLATAKNVMDFAIEYRGSYQNGFYPSFSGYDDDLRWGAAWILKATKNSDKYLNFLKTLGDYQVPNMFSWDNKYAGFSVLMSRRFLSKDKSDPNYQEYSTKSENFICTMLNPSIYTKGGLMFLNLGGSNLQYVTGISFLMVTYAKYMSIASHTFNCGSKLITNKVLKSLAKPQVDYILGKNANGTSYMVGYGEKYPKRIHHRASSLPSIREHNDSFGCDDGASYLKTWNANPNELTGAVTGGPDGEDNYADDRSNFGQSEPTTYINAPFVGTLAYFAGKPK